jgi:hypothetical protein
MVHRKIRGKFADEKFLGSEPIITENSTDLDMLGAYNWFNYFYMHDQGKEFVLSYLKKEKLSKDKINFFNQIPSHLFGNDGWKAKLLLDGNKLPLKYVEQFKNKLKNLEKTYSSSYKKKDVEEKEEKVVISIQDRMRNKASKLSAELEGNIDNIMEGKESSLSVKKFYVDNAIKPGIAAYIIEKYKPVYSELYDAYHGKGDSQLKEGYSLWNKKTIKKLMEYVLEIISVGEDRHNAHKTIRKPRKKKEKSPLQLVAKLKFQEKFDTLSLQSIAPRDIIGANQLWVFNTKTRFLFVYHALAVSGLSVKGSTLQGYDEKTSIGKKLRKPEEQIKSVLSSGKVSLRKIMENIRAKPKEGTGRINKDMILLRVIK